MKAFPMLLLWLSRLLYMHGAREILPSQGVRYISFLGAVISWDFWDACYFISRMSWGLSKKLSDFMGVRIWRNLWHALLHLQLTNVVVMGSGVWVSGTLDTEHPQGGILWGWVSGTLDTPVTHSHGCCGQWTQPKSPLLNKSEYFWYKK